MVPGRHLPLGTDGAASLSRSVRASDRANASSSGTDQRETFNDDPSDLDLVDLESQGHAALGACVDGRAACRRPRHPAIPRPGRARGTAAITAACATAREMLPLPGVEGFKQAHLVSRCRRRPRRRVRGCGPSALRGARVDRLGGTALGAVLAPMLHGNADFWSFVRADRKHPYQHPYGIAPCAPCCPQRVIRVRLARLTRKNCASGMRYQVSSEHPIRAQSSQCRTRALSASTLIRTLTPLAHAGRLGQGGPLPPCRDALRAVSECRSRAQIGSLGAGFAKSRLSGPSHGSFTRSHTHFDLLAGPVPRHAAVTTHERGSHLDEPQPTSDPGRCAGLIDALVARTKCTTHPTLSSEPDSSRLVTRGRR